MKVQWEGFGNGKNEVVGPGALFIAHVCELL